MKQTRVLILGATGMLGHKLCDVLGTSRDLEVHATTRGTLGARGSGLGARDSGLGVRDSGLGARDETTKPTETQLIEFHTGIDLSDGTRALRPVLDRVAPDVIVNAVGAIKQKDLLAAIDETFFINGSLPHELTMLNPNPDGRVIHISTDCVFAGDRGAYRESDRPDVTDVYGRSKAAGEIEYGRHLTLRTSIVGFERHGHLGLLSWFFSQPPGTTVRGFTGAIYSGLPTVTLAHTIRDLLARPELLTGLYHVASEPIRKYDLLLRLNQTFARGLHVEPDDRLRMDRSLDDSRFRAKTGTARPGWDQLIAELKQDYDNHDYDAVYEARRHSVTGR